jgi:hypothetical protein
MQHLHRKTKSAVRTEYLFCTTVQGKLLRTLEGYWAKILHAYAVWVNLMHAILRVLSFSFGHVVLLGGSDQGLSLTWAIKIFCENTRSTPSCPLLVSAALISYAVVCILIYQDSHIWRTARSLYLEIKSDTLVCFAKSRSAVRFHVSETASANQLEFSLIPS